MKTKLSISINRELLSKVDHLVEIGVFRNRSHAVDFSIKFFKGGANNGR